MKNLLPRIKIFRCVKKFQKNCHLISREYYYAYSCCLAEYVKSSLPSLKCQLLFSSMTDDELYNCNPHCWIYLHGFHFDGENPFGVNKVKKLKVFTGIKGHKALKDLDDAMVVKLLSANSLHEKRKKLYADHLKIKN